MKQFAAFVAALLIIMALSDSVSKVTSAECISEEVEDVPEEVDGVSEVTAADCAAKEVSSVRIPWVCYHEEKGKMFSFQFENSTAMSYIQPFCKNCTHYFGYSHFRDTPSDISYLGAVEEYILEDGIFGGRYCTMSATVALRDYDVTRTRVRCQIQNDDIIVNFSVEFREEFDEAVSAMSEGDEITFRGRLYDKGFGWTDCELIN